MTAETDPIHMAPDGTIRVVLGGPQPKSITLRRPSFGEIKDLIRAEKTFENTRLSVVTTGKVRSAGIADGVTAPDVASLDLDQLSQLRDKAQGIAQDLEDQMAIACEGWWSMVFGLLGPDPAPDPAVWPSQCADPGMPERMVRHWRFIPSGPG